MQEAATRVARQVDLSLRCRSSESRPPGCRRAKGKPEFRFSAISAEDSLRYQNWIWWPRPDLNRHACYQAADFKSAVSTSSTTRPRKLDRRPSVGALSGTWARIRQDQIMPRAWFCQNWGSVKNRSELSTPREEGPFLLSRSRSCDLIIVAGEFGGGSLRGIIQQNQHNTDFLATPLAIKSPRGIAVMTIAIVEMTTKTSTPPSRKWPCQIIAAELPLEVMNKFEAAHGFDASAMCLAAVQPYAKDNVGLNTCDDCPYKDFVD